MNDNQITNDLLEELEELESSAVEMDKQLEASKTKKEALDEMDAPSSIDATALAMEAAKMAQDAASHSQKAAEASLNHASRQKEQIMELADANFSWRQAVKSATKEISSSKTKFSIMLGASIVTSLTAMSVMGWMLYSMQQKEAKFKGEVLDILQTENALLTKQITIKVDELSGLIELMTADIQKINKMGSVIQASITGNPTMANTAQPSETIETEDGATPPTTDVKNSDELVLDLASEVAEPKATKVNETPEKAEKTIDAQHLPTGSEHQTTPMTSTHSQEESNQHFIELKALMQKILEAQHQLEAKTLAPASSHSGASLTKTQEKQLKDISWLVRKQSKTLEQIKQTIGTAPSSTDGKKMDISTRENQQRYKAIQGSLIELKDQLGKLRDQQNQLQSQVDGLQKETKKLSDAAKPYSYQLKQ